MRCGQQLEGAVEGVLAQEGCQGHARQQPQVMPTRPDRPLWHAQLPAPDAARLVFEKDTHMQASLASTRDMKSTLTTLCKSYDI